MQHPDEGTIHAWLDGALGSDEARSLAAHVGECPACAAAVTEARGLLAASSRILSALDAVPGGVLPAATPETDTAITAIAPRGSSRWRSPGLRAAAAIVLVGSVSWLATRSGQKASIPAATTDTITSAAAAPQRVAAPVVVQEAPAQNREAASERTPVNVAPRAPLPKPAAPATPSNAAPLRQSTVPNGMAAGQGAGAGTAAMADAATGVARSAVVPAPPNAEAGGAAQREARAPAAAAAGSAGEMLSARKAATAPTLMQQAAPRMRENAALLVQLPETESEVERLAGCYLLETANADTRDTTGAGRLPTAIELGTTLDSLGGGRARVVRPAPGALPFAAGTRATWMLLGPSSIRIQSSDAVRSLSETLVVKGDSVTGEAAIVSAASGTMRAAVRGARTSCDSH